LYACRRASVAAGRCFLRARIASRRIDNALMLVRERFAGQSIAHRTNIAARLGQIQADERKVRQVVLNLLSNAIKFTPEGGRIDVGAVPKDGVVEVWVSDTGIGIAPEPAGYSALPGPRRGLPIALGRF